MWGRRQLVGALNSGRLGLKKIAVPLSLGDEAGGVFVV